MKSTVQIQLMPIKAFMFKKKNWVNLQFTNVKQIESNKTVNLHTYEMFVSASSSPVFLIGTFWTHSGDA